MSEVIRHPSFSGRPAAGFLSGLDRARPIIDKAENVGQAVKGENFDKATVAALIMARRAAAQKFPVPENLVGNQTQYATALETGLRLGILAGYLSVPNKLRKNLLDQITTELNPENDNFMYSNSTDVLADQIGSELFGRDFTAEIPPYPDDFLSDTYLLGVRFMAQLVEDYLRDLQKFGLKSLAKADKPRTQIKRDIGLLSRTEVINTLYFRK